MMNTEYQNIPKDVELHKCFSVILNHQNSVRPELFSLVDELNDPEISLCWLRGHRIESFGSRI